jgi:hypothetical protein
VSEQWKLLGFQGTDPATDFRGMGLLGLHTLIYFAEQQPEQFRGIIAKQQERKERDYPVAVVGINVCQMLYDLLMGTSSGFSKTSTTNMSTQIFPVFPLLLDSSYAFEEMYCVSLRILDNTWDEMNASYMDFPRVLLAVKNQISTMLLNPAMTTFEQFQRAAFNRSYSVANFKSPLNSNSQTTSGDVTDKPEAESVKRMNAKFFQEVLDLIKKQKISYLSLGACFKLQKPKPKQPQYYYIQLSDAKTEFIVGPASSPTATSPEVPSSLKVVECVEVLVGDSTKGKAKKVVDDENAFSLIVKDASKNLEIIASSREEFLNWTDGLRALLLDKLENPESFDDAKVLVKLEKEIQLLDLAGVSIPSELPSPPPLPDHYNFVSN